MVGLPKRSDMSAAIHSKHVFHPFHIAESLLCSPHGESCWLLDRACCCYLGVEVSQALTGCERVVLCGVQERSGLHAVHR
jgi:hypothetical protein